MKYELLTNGRGVLVDPSPILNDVKGSLRLSFVLPDDGCGYYAVFKDAKAVEHKVKIDADGVCSIPYTVLTKFQYVELFVHRLNADAEIIGSWICTPLKISSLSLASASQWLVEPSTEKAELFSRLAELEHKDAAQSAEISELRAAVQKLSEIINSHIKRVIK